MPTFDVIKILTASKNQVSKQLAEAIAAKVKPTYKDAVTNMSEHLYSIDDLDNLQPGTPEMDAELESLCMAINDQECAYFRIEEL